MPDQPIPPELLTSLQTALNAAAAAGADLQAATDAASLAAATERIDSDEAHIDALTATVADLQGQLNAESAHSANLQGQLDVVLAQLAALAPPRPAPKIAVGAHVNGISFAEGQNRLGPIPVTRHFFPGDLPTDFGVVAKQYPPGTKVLVSYTHKQTNVAKFVKSAVASGQLWGLTYHHEPENPSKYGGVGSKFIAEWDPEFDTVMSADDRAYMPMIAMSYQYRKGGTGASGAFLPDPAKVSAYYVDDYSGSGLPGLAKDNTEFGPWYALVKDRGKPLGFAEYGRALLAKGQTGINNRLATMAADTAWLLAHPEFELLLYWYATGSAGDWRFTDAASIAAWKRMVATLTAA